MERELAKRIGQVARSARKAHGLTQEDAAERIGISFEFYARIERGGTLPSVPTLAKLADALGVSADALLGREKGRLSGMAPELPRPSEGTPELRRLVRRLRRARSRTLKILSVLVAELERRG